MVKRNIWPSYKYKLYALKVQHFLLKVTGSTTTTTTTTTTATTTSTYTTSSATSTTLSATISATTSTSKPTSASDTGQINTPRKRIDDNGDWILRSTVGASVALLIIIVVSVVAIVFFRKW